MAKKKAPKAGKFPKQKKPAEDSETDAESDFEEDPSVEYKYNAKNDGKVYDSDAPELDDQDIDFVRHP